MLLSCHCKFSDQISDDIKKMLSVSPIINQSDLILHLDDVVCVIFCQKQLMGSITRSTTFHQNQNNSRNDCNQHNSSQSWANDQSRLCQKKPKNDWNNFQFNIFTHCWIHTSKKLCPLVDKFKFKTKSWQEKK